LSLKIPVSIRADVTSKVAVTMSVPFSIWRLSPPSDIILLFGTFIAGSLMLAKPKKLPSPLACESCSRFSTPCSATKNLGNLISSLDYEHSRSCSRRGFAQKTRAVIDRPYRLGRQTVGALYERPRCIFCAKPPGEDYATDNFKLRHYWMSNFP